MTSAQIAAVASIAATVAVSAFVAMVIGLVAMRLKGVKR